MFAAIGRLADRYRLVFLLGWLVAAVVITLTAPNLNDVTSNDQGDFLPDDASSIAGRKLVETNFPEQASDGSIVLVFDAGEGHSISDPANMAYIGDVSNWLNSPEGPDHIQSVLSPTLNPEMSGQLVSPDGQISMVVIATDTQDQEASVVMLDQIGKRLESAPMQVYRTGDRAINREYNDTIQTSVDRTIFVTLALVVLILLAIYRSPVSPLIPLFVVTIAFFVARGLVAWLAKEVFTVSDTAVMMLIVVMYGAGTDYCLFLISRFREEMAEHDDSRPAVRRTVRHVGESISSSAGTVITGFVAMAFAQLGLFNTTGPTLAVGVIVSLLAGLTLTPALLGLLGQRTFWPGRAHHRGTGAIYKRTSQWVSSRPLLTIVTIVVLMAPLAYYGSKIEVTYDFLADLPDDTESVEGFRVLENHIGAGEMQPLTAVAVFPGGDLLSQSERVTRELEAVDGVVTVRSATQPLGGADPMTAGITRIDHQLGALAAMVAPGTSAPGQGEGGTTSTQTPEQQAMMQNLLADLPAYLALVVDRAPELANNPAYDQTMASLNAVAQGGDLTPDLAAGFGALAEAAPAVYLPVAELPEGVRAAFGGDLMAGLISSYVNPNTNAVRFEIVLDHSPYSLTALNTADDLADVMHDTGGKAGVTGSSVVGADLRHYLQMDQRLTMLLVLGGIFLILLVMLRSVVAPMYLIGTILLSYRTSLGITRIASGVLWGTDQLTWWVPFFMFVFLVALGIDYSIFLFGRIKEEVGRNGIHEGIHHAVQSTGSIITSAGIIVAGTFAAMMAGDILGLAQIGFAVSVGILIDTFVVRTVLDPALATFFGRWTWWPGGLNRTPQPAEETAPVVPELSGTD